MHEQGMIYKNSTVQFFKFVLELIFLKGTFSHFLGLFAGGDMLPGSRALNEKSIRCGRCHKTKTVPMDRGPAANHLAVCTQLGEHHTVYESIKKLTISNMTHRIRERPLTCPQFLKSCSEKAKNCFQFYKSCFKVAPQKCCSLSLLGLTQKYKTTRQY